MTNQSSSINFEQNNVFIVGVNIFIALHVHFFSANMYTRQRHFE